MAEHEWRLGHRPGLDQLRGVAVLMVLVGHGLEGLELHNLAAVGVTLFFVLSGFLITRLLIEERTRTGGVALGRFYVRRARRLLPALVVAVPVFAVTNVVLGWPVLRPAVAALTYTSNFATLDGTAGSFSHLWSLAVEEHFYLVWPLLMAVLPLRLLPAIAGGGVLLSAGSRMLFAVDHEAYALTHYRLDGILIGASLAFIAARLSKPTTRVVTLAGAVLLLFGAPEMIDAFRHWGITVTSLVSAVLVVRCLETRRRRPLLERMGRISYGVYLLHYPVLLIMVEGLAAPVWATLTATTVGGIVLGELSWRVVEARALTTGSPSEVAGRTQADHTSMTAGPVAPPYLMPVAPEVPANPHR